MTTKLQIVLMVFSKKVRYDKIRVKNMIRDYKSKNLQDILKERLNDDSGCTESKNARRIYAGI